MSVWKALFLVSSLIVTPTWAEDPASFKLVSPASVGLDRTELGKLDSFLSTKVDQGVLRGALVLISRGHEVGFLQTWGDRNTEDKLPMSHDTIFRIYSMSKPITSVAVMQLVEQGKIELDESVATYLPAFAELTVYSEGTESKAVAARNPMTVRDLLRHTSGLTYGFFSQSAVDKKYLEAGILMSNKTLAEMVSRLAKLPLLHEPGTRWHYSVSTDVLGRLVEVASDQRFDEYLAEHIFEPLGMTDTGFFVPVEKRSRFAQLYTPDGDQLKPAAPGRSFTYLNPANEFFSGGGGLCSTARDYHRFCLALLNGGELEGNRILKDETIKEMTTNQLDASVKRSRGFEFGLGFSISPEGEYAWGGAAGTRFFINPKRNLIGIYMIQVMPYNDRDYTEMLRKIVYAADQQPQ